MTPESLSAPGIDPIAQRLFRARTVIIIGGARIRMIGTGWVASAGALVYVAAPREQRFCLPNTRFLLHQPAGGAGGTASDIDIEARD